MWPFWRALPVHLMRLKQKMFHRKCNFWLYSQGHQSKPFQNGGRTIASFEGGLFIWGFNSYLYEMKKTLILSCLGDSSFLQSRWRKWWSQWGCRSLFKSHPNFCWENSRLNYPLIFSCRQHLDERDLKGTNAFRLFFWLLFDLMFQGVTLKWTLMLGAVVTEVGHPDSVARLTPSELAGG